MLKKAYERISSINTGIVTVHHGDFRTINFTHEKYNIILAVAVLHHLRDEHY